MNQRNDAQARLWIRDRDSVGNTIDHRLDEAELERLAGAASINLERQLDNATRIEAFRACMDEQGRTMYDLRVLGFNWRRIARLAGYSDGHSAEVQFRRKMDRALERFWTSNDSRWKTQSSE